MKIQRIKKTGDQIINYDSIFARSVNRFRMLKGLVKGRHDITLIVDTNQRTLKKPIEAISEYLMHSNIIFKSLSVSANKSKFFGFDVKITKEANEKLIITDIAFEQFTEELFNEIKYYDIAIGLDRVRTFDETSDSIIQNISGVLYNKDFFADSIYDSAVCSSIRCSSGINNIEAIINEMGL